MKVSKILIAVIFTISIGLALYNIWWCLFVSTCNGFNLYMWWAISSCIQIMATFGAIFYLDTIGD